jgi:hypothetical protein
MDSLTTTPTATTPTSTTPTATATESNSDTGRQTRRRKAAAIAGSETLSELAREAKDTGDKPSKYLAKKEAALLQEEQEKKKQAAMELARTTRGVVIGVAGKAMGIELQAIAGVAATPEEMSNAATNALAQVLQSFGIEVVGKWAAILMYLAAEGAFVASLMAQNMAEKNTLTGFKETPKPAKA